MTDGALEPHETGAGGAIRLWQAVIMSTIKEWVSGPLRRKREAEKYLFSPGSDFKLVCESAGMDAERLRAQLRRLQLQGGATQPSTCLGLLTVQPTLPIPR
jgi:hypothetical protein